MGRKFGPVRLVTWYDKTFQPARTGMIEKSEIPPFAKAAKDGPLALHFRDFLREAWIEQVYR
jgi:hypothetical protein